MAQQKALRVAVVTVSDSAALRTRDDRSGPAVADRCRALGWDVVSREILPDETIAISEKLVTLANSGSCDVILTTGGTGVGPRDITPEATANMCEKLVPGLAERMRQQGMRATPRAALSRAVAGVRGRVLIVNLPGSPKGAVESLEAVAELLPHAAEVIGGARHD